MFLIPMSIYLDAKIMIYLLVKDEDNNQNIYWMVLRCLVLFETPYTAVISLIPLNE